MIFSLSLISLVCPVLAQLDLAKPDQLQDWVWSSETKFPRLVRILDSLAENFIRDQGHCYTSQNKRNCQNITNRYFADNCAKKDTRRRRPCEHREAFKNIVFSKMLFSEEFDTRQIRTYVREIRINSSRGTLEYAQHDILSVRLRLSRRFGMTQEQIEAELQDVRGVNRSLDLHEKASIFRVLGLVKEILLRKYPDDIGCTTQDCSNESSALKRKPESELREILNSADKNGLNRQLGDSDDASERESSPIELII